MTKKTLVLWRAYLIIEAGREMLAVVKLEH